MEEISAAQKLFGETEPANEKKSDAFYPTMDSDLEELAERNRLQAEADERMEQEVAAEFMDQWSENQLKGFEHYGIDEDRLMRMQTIIDETPNWFNNEKLMYALEGHRRQLGIDPEEFEALMSDNIEFVEDEEQDAPDLTDDQQAELQTIITGIKSDEDVDAKLGPWLESVGTNLDDFLDAFAEEHGIDEEIAAASASSRNE